jgi:hypothetical protein
VNGSLSGLDPRLLPTAREFVALLESVGLTVTVTSVVRNRAKQEKLYREYLAAQAKGEPHLPALPPGRSLHEHGLAWDMVVSPPHYQKKVGQLWKRLGGQWGGDAPVGYDPVHFQAKQFL